MKIYSESIEGQIYYLWDLSNDAWEDGGEWWDGQVSFNTNRVTLQVLKFSGKILLYVLACVPS